MPRLYERFGLNINRGCHRNEVRFVAFEEAQQRGEERGLVGARAQLFRPDSGQIEKALRPTFVTKRLGQGGEGNNQGITVV